jgi:hypothetical protein
MVRGELVSLQALVAGCGRRKGWAAAAGGDRADRVLLALACASGGHRRHPDALLNACRDGGFCTCYTQLAGSRLAVVLPAGPAGTQHTKHALRAKAPAAVC